MYSIFHKGDFADKPSTQNLRRYSNFFNFTGFVHPDKLQSFWEDISLQMAASDLIASGIANLQSQTTPNSDFIKTSLDCCRDLMFHRGYEEDYSYDLRSVIDGNTKSTLETNNVIVILGCQTDKMIQNRAYAGAMLYHNLYHLKKGKTVVVFSGLTTPLGNKKRINQEFKRIKYYFLEKLESLLNKDRNELSHLLDINAEYKSQTSLQNIKELVSTVLLKRFKNCDINLFIVSSNFHLFRLSVEMEKELLSDAISKALKKSKINLNKLSFIGAETLQNNLEVVCLPEYIKSMTFEIYAYLFKNSIFEKK